MAHKYHNFTMKHRKILKLYIKTLKLLKIKVPLMNDRKLCIEGDLPTDT